MWWTGFCRMFRSITWEHDEAGRGSEVRQQKPVVELYPHSQVSQCIHRLSEKIIETRNQIPEEGDRPFLWKNVFEVR